MELVSASGTTVPLWSTDVSGPKANANVITDRGNGFEKKWIMAQNAAARREYEGNQMDMEDL